MLTVSLKTTTPTRITRKLRVIVTINILYNSSVISQHIQFFLLYKLDSLFLFVPTQTPTLFFSLFCRFDDFPTKRKTSISSYFTRLLQI